MNGIDDLFEEDLGLETEPISEEIHSEDNIGLEDNIFEDPVKIEPTSLVNDLLASKGISNGKIKLIGEDNSEQEIDFFSLSKDEQLEILSSSDLDHDYNLEDDEIEIINTLRTNGVTWKEYLESYKNQVLAEAQGQLEPTYEIDLYDDHELFLLDLKTKYELTDEELAKELEKELKDENLFKKKVDKLRTEYKAIEDQHKLDQQAEQQRLQQEKYDNFVSTMVDVAVKTPDLHGIELEDNEKNEVLAFLLDLDQNGVSNFYKTLNDPAKLYEAAWFLKYGKDAFNVLVNTYESEIAKLKKDKKPQVVVKKPATSKPNSIHDLY